MLEVQCNTSIGSLHMDASFRTAQPWAVLFGPSGSGKSTLLRLIAGLWKPAGGRVQINGMDVSNHAPQQRRATLIAQQPALFPHMTVEQNISFTCRAGTECRDAIDAVVELFELQHYRTAKPQSLSGGEKQRVALARALCAAPKLLLLDEVFTGMHRAQREELSAKLRDWCTTQRISVLSVTHDVPEALRADEVIRIEEGRIIAQGLPKVVLSDERKAMLLDLSQHGIT